MTRHVLPLALTLLPLPASAHLGHLGDVAGHDHWVAGAAIGVAVAIGLWGALKGHKAAKPEATPDAPTTPDDQDEAAA